MIIPAIEPLVVVQRSFERGQIVERHQVHEVGHGLRNAGRGDSIRVIGGAEHVEVAPLRHHHCVVVAVIRPFDLDDLVATRDGSHQVDGIHGRLGAGVVEPPQRLTEPIGELAGDDDGVVGRLGEVGAFGDPALHCLDDCRVGMAGDHHAVAAVQVDVLGAVDVPDT